MNTIVRQQAGLVGFVRSFATAGLWISAFIGAFFWYASGNWIIFPSMMSIWLFWRVLPAEDAPPGLQFAFSYHLFQIVAGVIYTALTGRYLSAHQTPQYHYMMVLAVASLLAIFVGFISADAWLARRRSPIARVPLDVTLKHLFVAYLFAVLSRDLLIGLVNEIPSFAQAILAISAIQIGLLYLVLRKLFRERRYFLIVVIVGFETVRGFSAFYSSFKEPLILALIAGMEVFEPRKVSQWLLTSVIVVSALALSVVWLGIRGNIRQGYDASRSQTAQLRIVAEEARQWWKVDRQYKLYDVDDLAERVWDIYYSALALDRVPALVPHENGAIMWAAVQHVLTPRFLNPNKPALPSESDDVNKYSGMRVAGREQGTTIAFGYVIQSYIDFGVPTMFLPPLFFGLILGLAHRWFLTSIHHDEILIAILAVAFWMNVMPYNVSWAKMLGRLFTAFAFLGGAAVIVDHVLYSNRRLTRTELPPQGTTAHTR